MSNTLIKIPFGLNKSGRMTSVASVERGLKCECVCPSCNAPLEAHKGELKAWHFSHHTLCDCTNAGETAIHAMAKQLLADHRRLFVPTYTGASRFTLQFDEVRLEQIKRSGGLCVRPDATCLHAGDEVFVEIAVEHYVGAEKFQKLCRLGVPTIEIAVPRLDGDSEWTEEKLETYVIENAESKKWLFLPSTLPEIEIAESRDTPFKELWLGLKNQSGALKITEARIKNNMLDRGVPLNFREAVYNSRVDLVLESYGMNTRIGEIIAAAAIEFGGVFDGSACRTVLRGAGLRFIEIASKISSVHSMFVERVVVRHADQAVEFNEKWHQAWQPILRQISRNQSLRERHLAMSRLKEIEARLLSQP